VLGFSLDRCIALQMIPAKLQPSYARSNLERLRQVCVLKCKLASALKDIHRRSTIHILAVNMRRRFVHRRALARILQVKVETRFMYSFEHTFAFGFNYIPLKTIN